jgi:outer membrane scaffolding protein for murein synthesis (MipA/OmpV family)
MKLFLIVLSVVIVLVAQSAQAQELPLWEAGAGLTGLSLPEYRGADHQRSLLLPLPYLVYRGRLLKVDRKGINSLLFESDRLRLNMSFDAGAPVRSSGNNARTGMSDLDPTIQMGPSLEVCLVHDCTGDRALQFRLPVRLVYAVQFLRMHGSGLVVNPQLSFDMKNAGQEGWNFGAAMGPLFATEKYHDYYYEVAPQFAVSGIRPAYDARGGYSGALAILSLSKRFDRFWFGSFFRYDNLSGAVFESSPLVKARHSYMGGFGFAWVFGRSKTLVFTAP